MIIIILPRGPAIFNRHMIDIAIKTEVIFFKQGIVLLIIFDMLLSAHTQMTTSGTNWSCPNNTEANITMIGQYKNQSNYMVVKKDIGIVCLQSDVFSSLGNILVSLNRKWQAIKYSVCTQEGRIETLP